MSYLSVNDIRRRWSCGRDSVYRAIREMKRDGYLTRMYLGRVQRISQDSEVRQSSAPSPVVSDMKPKDFLARLRASRRARRAKRPRRLAGHWQCRKNDGGPVLHGTPVNYWLPSVDLNHGPDD